MDHGHKPLRPKFNHIINGQVAIKMSATFGIVSS
jgi:hypothetical protein